MEISEVKVRNEFFVSALFVESTITDYLSEKLNISDSINSEFLGNHQAALSFSQKIDALLDSVNFSIIDKSKISVFREIYLEFMQNKEASTLEESFTSADSNDDFLLILYPQNDYLPREEKLINASYQLIGEVSELVADQTQKPEVKMPRRNRFFNLDNLKVGKFATLFSFLLIS
ncbi:hypothetical protein [Lutimonas sp.]|uniref:hypothetical protein n=1 Tax=Lutimonas sp. TaxID=1872403 RepID=UPI003D9BD153